MYLAAVAVSALAEVMGEVGAGVYTAAVETMFVVDSVILVILCAVREQYPGPQGSNEQSPWVLQAVLP